MGGSGDQGWGDYNGGGGWQPDTPSPEQQKDITVTFTEWQTVTAPAPEQNNVPPMTVC
jgi:hypothetical protein